jgi:hypothetical protein
MTLCALRNTSKNARTGKRMPPDECRLGLHMLGKGFTTQEVFTYYDGWIEVLKPREWSHVTKCTITNIKDCPVCHYLPMAEKRAD